MKLRPLSYQLTNEWKRYKFVLSSTEDGQLFQASRFAEQTGFFFVFNLRNKGHDNFCC